MVLCYSSSRKLILYSKVRTELLWGINECLLCQRIVREESLLRSPVVTKSWSHSSLRPYTQLQQHIQTSGLERERTTVWRGIIAFEMLLLLFPSPDSTPTHSASTQTSIILYNCPLLHFSKTLKRLAPYLTIIKEIWQLYFRLNIMELRKRYNFFSCFSVTISCTHVQVIKFFFLISEIVTKPWSMQRRITYQSIQGAQSLLSSALNT